MGVIYYNIYDDSDLPTLIYSLSIGVFFLSICGIFERFSDINLLFSFPTASDIYSFYQVSYDSLRDDVRRIRGPFVGAVQYSGFGPLMLLCSLYVFNKKKVIGTIFLIIVTTCLFFCVSRTAIYLFGIYILIYFSMAKQKKALIFGFSGLLIFFIILFPMEIYRAIDMGLNPYEFDYSGGNTEGRLALIKEGFNTIMFSMFSTPFGIGSGDDLQDLIISDVIFSDLCNFYIGYGITKGIFFISLFIYLICFLLWKLFWLAQYTNDETARLFFVSFLSTFIGLLSYAEINITLPIILILYLVLKKTLIADAPKISYKLLK